MDKPTNQIEWMERLNWLRKQYNIYLAEKRSIFQFEAGRYFEEERNFAEVEAVVRIRLDEGY